MTEQEKHLQSYIIAFIANEYVLVDAQQRQKRRSEQTVQSLLKNAPEVKGTIIDMYA